MKLQRERNLLFQGNFEFLVFIETKMKGRWRGVGVGGLEVELLLFSKWYLCEGTTKFGLGIVLYGF